MGSRTLAGAKLSEGEEQKASGWLGTEGSRGRCGFPAPILSHPLLCRLPKLPTRSRFLPPQSGSENWKRPRLCWLSENLPRPLLAPSLCSSPELHQVAWSLKGEHGVGDSWEMGGGCVKQGLTGKSELEVGWGLNLFGPRQPSSSV